MVSIKLNKKLSFTAWLLCEDVCAGRVRPRQHHRHCRSDSSRGHGSNKVAMLLMIGGFVFQTRLELKDMDSKWLFLSNPDSSSSSLASFPQCRRPSRIKKIAEEEKNTGKETLSEREKPGKHQIVFEIFWVWDSVSSENYIFALYCVEPKVDRKLPKPTKFHNTAFQMFLEQDCDSSGGKNPLPPSQPNRRRLIFRNQTFLLLFSK